jgi:membrane associated rhomboid family serine protease
LIANVASYLIGTFVGRPYIYLFGLVPESVLSRLYIWQLVTYLFLHGGFFHLFFNMFALWMFGSDLEWNWGSRFFLKFYFLAGVGAGLFTVLLSKMPTVPTIGASGAVFAILMAFALTFPNRLIYLYFLFPIKAKYFMLIFFVIEFWASAVHVQDGIGHVTHLGGMLIAYFYLRSGNFSRALLDGIGRERRKRRIKVVRRKDNERDRLKSEVDRVLDKISREGIERLTGEEWEILNRASKLIKPGEDSDRS